MLQQSSWTFRYSLEGFLKRVLHCAPCPLTAEGLVETVLSDWAGPEQSRESIAARVRASLEATNGAFASVGNDKFTLRQTAGDDLQNHAYHFLKKTKRPQKQGDILRHLQQVTGRGRGELMSRVDLDCDPRFARLDGGEWLLTEWQPANDKIVQMMQARGIRRADSVDLLELVNEEAEQEYHIFYPEYDPRFALVGTVVECLLVELEAAATAEDTGMKTEEDNMTTTEQATVTSQATETTDLSAISTHQLVATVLKQLTDVSNELKQRNQDIPNEVLTLFNSEDLAGIEVLMGERKRVGALADDLALFVSKWSAE
ncbi:hypothetical protein CIG75_09170 [Tumebacillus algifaecis]|uniref:Uncharacterized protein n=1 Tax=Tumebacillus algifaecis TaxID=1214604 RepID=A0A223D130_9BACL|nr:hypothetical protein [Tumebacillus algifaecis]ASS75133.1 hypothetical protein CIG75_09170 [Tumebacillus algifaecis]